MVTFQSLRSEKEILEKLYRDELDTVLNLQELLYDHVIPDMVSELGIDERGQRNLEEWAADIPSIFRVLKRHKFVASFALENMRQIMFDRLHPYSRPRIEPTPFLRCLPLTSVDPFGRPVIIVKPKELQFSSPQLPFILRTCMEGLRVRFQQLNSKRDVKEPPVLQYIALLDMEGTTFVSPGWMEVISTFMQQVLPSFPGMLAAVFVLNYTWSFSGAWNFAKRLLPQRALSRVFFPSHEELLDYLTPECVPSDFGGLLPPSAQLEDLVGTLLKDSDAARPEGYADADAGCSRKCVCTPFDLQTTGPSGPAAEDCPSRPTPQHSPYYGYPVLHDTPGPIPTLRHGRRRKRDLLRTLASLFWARWHRHLLAALAAVAFIAILRMSRRTRLLFGVRGNTATLQTKLRRLIESSPGH
ncbi:CRAL/TRIO domain-containing protein [Rhodofomes roseus]|uniref:CRAL/TRIO domain-containing protein n=1 Tax=Rhodofomes roseus TaxID=34475 RepID=A0ABQ8KM43_9APHY|nr:CRAL/TRIO domain-containing protein [Rhodofomes roseus]KAH9839140.1 CRAL/TRIO domain-containing protein [Rhodofomes roseus]